MVLYNPNYQMFTYCAIIFSFSASGSITPNIEITVYTLQIITTNKLSGVSNESLPRNWLEKRIFRIDIFINCDI